MEYTLLRAHVCMLKILAFLTYSKGKDKRNTGEKSEFNSALASVSMCSLKSSSLTTAVRVKS